MSHATGLSAVDILRRVNRVLAALVLLSVCCLPDVTSADPGRHVNNNFASVPTTVKTRANDTIMLPCRHNGTHTHAH